MYKLILFYISTLIISNTFAKGGSGSSGGGSGFLLENGSVVLADLINANHSVFKESDNEYQKREYELLYKANRYITQDEAIVDEQSNFFNCALSHIENSDFSALKVILPYLKDSLVLRLNIQIEPFFKYLLYGPRNSKARLVAVYMNSTVYLNERLYSRMDNESKCGLAIHEAIRAFNDFEILPLHISENEIQALTRYLLYNEKNSLSFRIKSALRDTVSVQSKLEQMIKKHERFVLESRIVADNMIVVDGGIIDTFQGYYLSPVTQKNFDKYRYNKDFWTQEDINFLLYQDIPACGSKSFFDIWLNKKITL